MGFPVLFPFIPGVLLAAASLAVLLTGARRRKREAGSVVAFAVTVLGVTSVLVVVTAPPTVGPQILAGGILVMDGLAVLFELLILAVSVLVLLMAVGPLTRAGVDDGELVGMVLVADLGAFVLVSSTNLVGIFVGLELLTMAIIVLVGCVPHETRSIEGALKVFVTSAVFSAILLFGISVIYGAVGSLDLEAIRVHLQGIPHRNPMLGLGIAMVAFGLLFKVAAVPFHLWMPDATEGAPTPAAAFISVVPTVAVFAVFLRLFGGAFAGVADQWVELLWVVSAAAMIYGNVAALTQDNVKRLLAYSSVAHTGYALMGLVAVSGAGARAVIVYAVVVSFMNLGAFGIVALLESGGRVNPTVADFRGLGRRSPGAAAGMLIFLSALAGLPLTAGFVGRVVLWAAAIEAGVVGLVVIAVATSIVGLAAYSRIVVQMVLGNESDETITSAGDDRWTSVAVFLCAVVIVAVGVWPEPLVAWAAEGLVSLGLV